MCGVCAGGVGRGKRKEDFPQSAFYHLEVQGD